MPTPSARRALAPALGFALAALLGVGTARADAPGVGLTAPFEIDYLKSIMDHHFSALRMTELAAGTDATRDSGVPSPNDGTANTPGFGVTPAKSQIDGIKSLARRNNRMQREEIQTAQRFLHDWYGINYQPAPDAMQRRQIRLLESAQPGAQFDHLFLETLSRHHYLATTMSNECIVASDLGHFELTRYCSGIVNAQLNDIDEMRHTLCERFQICDYQPLRGLHGRHSGSEAEAGGNQE